MQLTVYLLETKTRTVSLTNQQSTHHQPLRNSQSSVTQAETFHQWNT